MKLANLWLFFFGSSASSSYAYNGSIPCHSGVAAVCVGPQAVEDSRGYFKRNALATPEGVAVVVRFDRVGVRASAASAPLGVRRGTAVGSTSASGGVDIVSKVVIPGRRAAFGQPRAVGSSAHAQAPAAGSRARVGVVQAEAAAGVLLHGVFARTRVGAAGAAVGIDEVEAELEEILFLLEVA